VARVVIIREFGGPEVLKSDSVSLAEPGPDEVRINQTAVGVNYIDTYYRTGLYPLDLPFIPGEEAVGIIEKLGSAVDGFQIGDRVAYASVRGAYAEQRNISSHAIVPLADVLPDRQIAASLTRGLTAEYLLFRCHALESGHTILVHAAAGGVGSITCQWAKSMGATVFGTVGNAAKIQTAKQNGCDEVMVHTEEKVSDVIRDKTRGEMVDVVYDGVGRDTLIDSIHCVKPRGLVVSFGNASGAPAPLDILELSRQGSVYITRPRLYDYLSSKSELMNAAKNYFDALADNKINFPDIVTLPLSEASRAHEILQDRSIKEVPVLIP